MPNLRKNPFSTDFYRLFQSTDKNDFVLSSATTPHPDFRLDSWYFAHAPSEPLRLRRVNFFGYYQKSHDFSDFRLSNPEYFREFFYDYHLLIAFSYFCIILSHVTFCIYPGMVDVQLFKFYNIEYTQPYIIVVR